MLVVSVFVPTNERGLVVELFDDELPAGVIFVSVLFVAVFARRLHDPVTNAIACFVERVNVFARFAQTRDVIFVADVAAFRVVFINEPQCVRCMTRTRSLNNEKTLDPMPGWDALGDGSRAS